MTVVRIVVFGVSSSGKSTVGEQLAQRLGATFLDADDFHPPANVEKMSAGEPLDDADRAPWLARLRDELADRDGVVLACSALKRRYRDVLRAAGDVTFVFLDLDEATARERAERRTDHFMRAEMIASQFDALERPTDAEADVLDVDATGAVEQVVETAYDLVAAESNEARVSGPSPEGTPTTMTNDEHADLREAAAELEWFHSIELAPGVVSAGRAPNEYFETMLADLQLPDLSGKTVLDIGAYDGYYSFAAERLGAERVVALDHYIWFTDMNGYMADWRRSQETGIALDAPHESSHWRPDELPGRRPFDLAHRALNSSVTPVVGDFMTMDLDELGQFDVVLFLGVLYHLESPLEAMRRLRSLVNPGQLVVLETEAMALDGHDESLCRFFPGRELNNDPSNWWVPNEAALRGLSHAAGFEHVSILSSPPPPATTEQPERSMIDRLKFVFDASRHVWRSGELPTAPPPQPQHYRALAHLRA